MEKEPSIQPFIASLNAAVDSLEEALEPILAKSLDELVPSSSDNRETQIHRIKTFNDYLYTLIGTLFSYLKTVGVNTDTHPIMQELDRIKSYMRRANSLSIEEDKEAVAEEKRKEESRAFLQNILGNGRAGASAPTSMVQPAISSSNFKGKHIKFEKKKTKQGKITKPRSKK